MSSLSKKGSANGCLSDTVEAHWWSRPGVQVTLGLILLGVVHWTVAYDTLRRKTPTVDEIAHLPAGISYWQRHTFKVYRHNPPLARLVAAAAAETCQPVMYYGQNWRKQDPINHWQFALAFLVRNADNPQQYLQCFTRSRMVIALWSALTIPFLFWWGCWWRGVPAGWLAAGLWAISPNIIAHAGMVTTDLAATSLGLIACFFFARWLDRPCWRRATVAGVCLGLAQLVKFSSLWLYILWPLWAAVYWATLPTTADRPGRLARWHPRFLFTTAAIRQCLFLGLLSLLVLNAGYLFEGTLRPLGEFPFVCDMLTRWRTPNDGPPDKGASTTYNQVHQVRVNRFRGSWLGWLPCPLPEHYIGGFDEQKFEADGGSAAFKKREGYQMYLRGELRRRSWWYYYVYALAIKVPLSTWFLLLLAGVGACVYSEGQSHRLWPWAMLIVVPLLAMSLLTNINIGVRYVLPVFPFVFLCAGSVLGSGRPCWYKLLAGLAVIWNVWALAAIHPNELAYFNESIGGPTQGRFHLIDSNLDWGQDLRGLSRWLARHPRWHDVRIAYMGTVLPEIEGITDYRLAPRDPRHVPKSARLPEEVTDELRAMGPQPGQFAISVNFERGMRFHTPCPIQLWPQIPPTLFSPCPPMLCSFAEDYAYFQHLTPRIEPQIGYSILLYDVSREEANRVRRCLGMPLLPDE